MILSRRITRPVPLISDSDGIVYVYGDGPSVTVVAADVSATFPVTSIGIQRARTLKAERRFPRLPRSTLVVIRYEPPAGMVDGVSRCAVDPICVPLSL